MVVAFLVINFCHCRCYFFLSLLLLLFCFVLVCFLSFLLFFFSLSWSPATLWSCYLGNKGFLGTSSYTIWSCRITDMILIIALAAYYLRIAFINPEYVLKPLLRLFNYRVLSQRPCWRYSFIKNICLKIKLISQWKIILLFRSFNIKHSLASYGMFE